MIRSSWCASCIFFYDDQLVHPQSFLFSFLDDFYDQLEYPQNFPASNSKRLRSNILNLSLLQHKYNINCCRRRHSLPLSLSFACKRTPLSFLTLTLVRLQTTTPSTPRPIIAVVHHKHVPQDEPGCPEGISCEWTRGGLCGRGARGLTYRDQLIFTAVTCYCRLTNSTHQLMLLVCRGASPSPCHGSTQITSFATRCPPADDYP